MNARLNARRKARATTMVQEVLRRSIHQEIGALALVTAIGLMAVACTPGSGEGSDALEAADQSPTALEAAPTEVDPAGTAAEDVAVGFLEAFGAFDAKGAMTYLTDDADVTGMTEGRGVEGLPLMTSLLEAVGYEQTITSCESDTSAPDSTVVCPFLSHGLRSDEIGLGPFSGNTFTVTIRDGEISQASMDWEVQTFSPQLWEPFADWVSTAHPQDATVMYTNASLTHFRLAKASVRLWEQRTREYAKDHPYPRPPTRRHVNSKDGVPFSLSVPHSGWARFGSISLNKSEAGPQGAEAMIYWSGFPDGDYADYYGHDARPCTRLLNPPVGPSTADLANAISTAPGIQLLSGPSDVRVGGNPAKHMMLVVREDHGCDPGFFYAWRGVNGGALWPRTAASTTMRVWIVDVDDTRLFIGGLTLAEASPELEHEVEQIVRSIRFDRG